MTTDDEMRTDGHMREPAAKATRDCLQAGGKLYLNRPEDRGRLIGPGGRVERELTLREARILRKGFEKRHAEQIVIVTQAGRHTAAEEPSALTTRQVVERWPQLKSYYSAPQQQLSQLVNRGTLSGQMFGPGRAGVVEIDDRFREWLAGRGISFDQDFPGHDASRRRAA